MSEMQVIAGVEKVLNGLTDIMETLEPTSDNGDLWEAIRAAEDMARRRAR